MNKLKNYSRYRTWIGAVLLSALAVGCGSGGRDPILGVGGVAVRAPIVTAVSPINNAADVAVDNPVINATFSEPMAPIVGTASFTVTCAAPCVNPTGTVALDASNRVATYTLTPGTSLAPLTLYTATVTGAKSLANGLAMDSPYVWTFTTGVRPRVTVTQPATTNPGPTTGVPVNTAITAIFTKDMAPATINGGSFTLTCAAPCVSPAGAVSYTVASRTAVFTPNAALASGTTYTATITTAANDLAGNALAGNQAALPAASNYVWTFTTQFPPTVTAVAPVNNATGVPTNTTMVNAAFSEPMQPITGGASFTVTCAAPCINPTGTVALDASNRIATYTVTSGNLAAQTLYTATITGARSLATGLALANPYVWRFTTGAALDTTRPRVTVTQPATTSPGPTTGVPANTAVTAVFTKDMAPATINGGSFTLTCAAPCVSPAGNVSYTVGSRTAVFTPNAVLASGITYTATIVGTGATPATDLAGNALAGNQAALPAASDYVWTFTTVAPAPPGNVSVMSTNPVAGTVGVCPGATVNVSFSVPSGFRMDPATVNTATFTVTGPAPASTPVTASSVVLDNATGRIATFTPASNLTNGVTYTAAVKGGANGVKDLANPANQMVNDFTWTFTAGPATGNCLAPVPLKSAAPFGTLGGSAGMTNQGLKTIVNGDIGTTAVSTSVTGFHDAGPGCTYTETPLNSGIVNGKIYTAAPPPTAGCPSEGTATTFAIASQARADALDAYNTLAGMPAGSDPGAGSLANLVLAPGVYTAAGGSFKIQGGDLTLDAQGNANAIWVFQMATSLTVGGPGAAFPQSIVLINGAQAKNVFWQVGSAATINAAGGGTMVGTIISQTGVAISTAGNTVIVTLNGRALSLGASVTVVNTVINVPAP
jgi:hypothetical protein